MRTSQNRQLVTFINYCKQSKNKASLLSKYSILQTNQYTVQHNKCNYKVSPFTIFFFVDKPLCQSAQTTNAAQHSVKIGLHTDKIKTKTKTTFVN